MEPDAPTADAVLLLGARGRDFLLVCPLARTYPDQQDYWEGNLLKTVIEARAGGFRAEINCQLRAEAFARFRDALEVLHVALSGTARFASVEQWLEIEVTGDGRGGFRARCEIRDNPALHNRLVVEIALDQRNLSMALLGLGRLLEKFPVVGGA